MTTIKIKYRDTHSILHAGDSTDSEGIIEIARSCFLAPEANDPFYQIYGLQLLRIVEFWTLDTMTQIILDFRNENKNSIRVDGFAKKSATSAKGRPLFLAVFSKQVIHIQDFVETKKWNLIAHAVGTIDPHDPDVTAFAASFGNLSLLKYLHELEFSWNTVTCAVASENGHLDCLQYAHEHGCPWDEDVYERAAKKGHLHCMKYAHEQGLREWDVDVCKNAARNGHFDCVQYAHEHGCPWDTWITKYAVEEDNIDFLLYALENGCPVHEKACDLVCHRGNLKCLQLLHQFGAPWDIFTASSAAVAPDQACLQYLHANGCPWDERTPDHAAQDGCIATLRYAMDHGCPFAENLVASAGWSSKITCLQYLVEEQSLFMDEKVFKVALSRGDLACVQYLIDHDCPYLGAVFSDQECRRIVFMDRKDNPEFLPSVVYAEERGWVPDRGFIKYVAARDRPCREWLEKEGYIEKSDQIPLVESDAAVQVQDLLA